MSDARRYAVWMEQTSRSRSRALERLNSFHFQNLSPPPFTMGAGKWPLILKLEHNIYIRSGRIFFIYPSFCVTWLWTWKNIVSCKNLIWFNTKLLRRQRLVSDARRNVRLYSTIKDRKSPLKGSRPSVPHWTNFYYYHHHHHHLLISLLLMGWLWIVFLQFIVTEKILELKFMCSWICVPQAQNTTWPIFTCIRSLRDFQLSAYLVPTCFQLISFHASVLGCRQCSGRTVYGKSGSHRKYIIACGFCWKRKEMTSFRTTSKWMIRQLRCRAASLEFPDLLGLTRKN